MTTRTEVRRIRGFAVVFLANILVILILLGLGELYLRSRGIYPFKRTYPGQQQNGRVAAWAQCDSVFGWTNKRSSPEINPQGFRDQKDFTKVEGQSPRMRVMILGDSFVYGTGVSENMSFPSRLYAKLKGKCEVYNLGVPGWGIDQMYLAFQHFENLINPGAVILAYIDDDIERVMQSNRYAEGLNKPTFAVKDGELVTRQSASKGQLLFDQLFSKSVLLSYLLREAYLVMDAKPIVNQILLDIAQETKRRGVRFIVVRIPTRDDKEILKRIRRQLNNFGSELQKCDVLYMDAAEEMTTSPGWPADFYAVDGHLNQYGNRVLADLIFRHVFEH
jgi:hypothetical protein